MSDITTCPKCKADLNVSTAPGEQLVCSRCGYTATKPLSVPAADRDTDVQRPGWRTAHYVVAVLLAVVGIPFLILLAACAVMWLNANLGPR